MGTSTHRTPQTGHVTPFTGNTAGQLNTRVLLDAGLQVFPASAFLVSLKVGEGLNHHRSRLGAPRED